MPDQLTNKKEKQTFEGEQRYKWWYIVTDGEDSIVYSRWDEHEPPWGDVPTMHWALPEDETEGKCQWTGTGYCSLDTAPGWDIYETINRLESDEAIFELLGSVFKKTKGLK